MAQRKLVLATRNAHKVREIVALLDGLPIEMSSLQDLGIASIPGEDDVEGQLVEFVFQRVANIADGANRLPVRLKILRCPLLSRALCAAIVTVMTRRSHP